MSARQNHGGKRQGAGRPRGSLNKRSIEAIEELAKRYPDWTPLLHFAAVANDESLPADIRLDAAKSAAPFMHARPKSIELDPEAAIELESRIARAKAQAMRKESFDPLSGLGDQLDRAVAKIEAFKRDG